MRHTPYTGRWVLGSSTSGLPAVVCIRHRSCIGRFAAKPYPGLLLLAGYCCMALGLHVTLRVARRRVSCRTDYFPGQLANQPEAGGVAIKIYEMCRSGRAAGRAGCMDDASCWLALLHGTHGLAAPASCVHVEWLQSHTAVRRSGCVAVQQKRRGSKTAWRVATLFPASYLAPRTPPSQPD